MVWNQFHAVNVLHVHAPGATESDIFTGFDTEISAQTSTTNVFRENSSLASVVSFEVLKLDGVSSTQVFVPTTWGGGSSGEVIPNQAAIVSLRTTLRGPQGRGRLFMGPVTEGNITNGRISSVRATQLKDNWFDFFAALVLQTPSIEPCVASYAHESFEVVNQVQVPLLMGTQRRRLRNA